jgi:hypothetical protein
MPPQLPPEQFEELLREVRLARLTAAEGLRDLSERVRKLEAFLSPEQVERLAAETAKVLRAVERVSLILEGVLRPHIPAIEEEELWRARIRSGEARLVHTIVGKRATYELWHHVPTCETHVVERLPGTGRPPPWR